MTQIDNKITDGENLYVLAVPNYVEVVSSELGFKSFQVEVVLDLTAEGSTVPFIARYRKERTGNLDEEQIRAIIELRDKTEKIYKAKQTAINGIMELGKMTPELFDNILKAKTLKEVEEIYKPYKSKKKTKAMIAIEKGFQFVADIIKKNIEITLSQPSPLEEKGQEQLDILLKEYSLEEILEGSGHIISAEVSANSDLRADLMETLQKYGTIISKKKPEKALEKLNEKDRGQISKFDIYSDFSLKISWLKPYQILALNRGENIGILGIKIEKTDMTLEGIKKHYSRILSHLPLPKGIDNEKGGNRKVYLPFIPLLEQAFLDGYEALFISVENELRGILSEVGEDDAIDTFKKNLANLLVTKPEYGKKVLAIDPGYRAGCKMVVLDELGNPVKFDKIYLHQENDAKSKLKSIFETEKIDVIVVGNGTGVNETITILQTLTDKEIYIVNESGASVYSASETAQEEFPDLDSLDRGTVSIGRRFIDPLSELVKVPVGSIGVGMYQHDVAEKKLEEKLGNVVEDTVNEVGINVNTASSYVLSYISGIDKRAAKKIYNNRPYKSRDHLKKQLSDKVYEQAAGFLRVPESKDILDNTDIHPEQYELVKYLEKPLSGILSPYQEKEATVLFSTYEKELKEIYPDVTIGTIEFILNSLNNAGVEKRVNSTHKKAGRSGEKADIKVGDTLEGVIRNVVAFGAFVDIGMKNDGLVHVSQISDSFVKDPKEVVEVGQTVRVKVTAINDKTGKIQLTMKGL
ncbi:MAG: Tex-like N-terminal domain-containing protein [Candidatus Gracilibacteria bacterium]|nr:Tex-like N-terminal domain-containing protein [Candidatus Gracilibacteria bacterium]